MRYRKPFKTAVNLGFSVKFTQILQVEVEIRGYRQIYKNLRVVRESKSTLMCLI